MTCENCIYQEIFYNKKYDCIRGHRGYVNISLRNSDKCEDFVHKQSKLASVMKMRYMKFWM